MATVGVEGRLLEGARRGGRSRPRLCDAKACSANRRRRAQRELTRATWAQSAAAGSRQQHRSTPCDANAPSPLPVVLAAEGGGGLRRCETAQTNGTGEGGRRPNGNQERVPA